MTSNQPVRHNPNCAIVRLGDIRAWCDCGAIAGKNQENEKNVKKNSK